MSKEKDSRLNSIFKKYSGRLVTYDTFRKAIQYIAREFEVFIPVPMISSEIKRIKHNYPDVLKFSDRAIEEALEDKYKQPRKKLRRIFLGIWRNSSKMTIRKL